MKISSFCLLPLFFLVLIGCSSVKNKSAPVDQKKLEALAKVIWSYGTNALQLSVKADPALNTYEGKAHSVVIAVIQTAEPTSFNTYLQNPDALARILQTGQPAGRLLQTTRFIAEPGQQATVQFDRVQNAKYVGLVVGYQAAPLAKTAKLFDVPVNVKKQGLFAHRFVVSPALADIQLTLGAESIINTAIKRRSELLANKKALALDANTADTGLFLLDDLNAL